MLLSKGDGAVEDWVVGEPQVFASEPDYEGSERLAERQYVGCAR